MGTCVYKIQFYKSSYQLNDEYERLSEHEKERISELDAEGFFDYNDDDDKYTVYVITTPLEIKQYLSILANNLVKYDLFDLSKDVLFNKIDLNEVLKDQINTTNSIKYSFFVDDVNGWVYQNLDMDTVLDRISDVGIDGLTDVEKDFLKMYNK